MEERFERRRHERVDTEIVCKVRCPVTGRYFGALTSDVSPGGAMITVQTPQAIVQGQTIEVALRTDGRPIVLRSEMAPAKVVRCSAVVDRHQVVAVRFDSEQGNLGVVERAAAA